jgi:hypothetical protein
MGQQFELERDFFQVQVHLYQDCYAAEIQPFLGLVYLLLLLVG